MILAIVFGHYLFKVEPRTFCWADNTSNYYVDAPSGKNPNVDAVDVAANFSFVLKLYFAGFIICAARELIEFITDLCYVFIVIPDSLLKGLYLGYGLQILAFFFASSYRMSHEGKVCSGDYLSGNDATDKSVLQYYLSDRGSFLWVWLVISWIIICICMSLCCSLGVFLFINKDRNLFFIR